MLFAESGRLAYGLLGLPFCATAVADAVACIRHALAIQLPLLLTTSNVNFVAACGKDTAFRNAVIESDLLVADGMPLGWIARMLGLPLRECVARFEIFQSLHLPAPGPLGPVKVFFFAVPLGGGEAVVSTPWRVAMVCVGLHSYGYGSFGSMSAPAFICVLPLPLQARLRRTTVPCLAH